MNCPTCGELKLSEYHRCQPQWECWEADGDRGDSRDVHGMDAEDAAAVFAEGYDQDDHLLLDGGTLTVHVVPKGAPDDVAAQVFKVTGEACPTYYAKEIVP